jgi:hypothetical protein
LKLTCKFKEHNGGTQWVQLQWQKIVSNVYQKYNS